jgi:PAS domain S-box-containing protein
MSLASDQPGRIGPGRPDAVVGCFEDLPALVWYLEGPDHRVVAVNRAGRAMVGDRPDLFGRPVREVVSELIGQQILEELDRVWASAEPVMHREWRVLVDRDGDGDLEEVYLSFTLAPRIVDGAVRGVLAHIVDVTEDVRRRESLEQRYLAAQGVVLTLQRSLLSDRLPVLPGMRIAARYLVADVEQAAGGDWFDAVALPDGRVGLVVGDVVGHGAAAAAVMGQLRAVLVEHLLDTCDIGQTLARMDRTAARIPGAAGTTVCLAVLDPEDGRLGYARCGHPPPLLLRSDGTYRYLDRGVGGPLGVAAAPPTVQTATVAVGDMLLCYSDGLVERPGRDLPSGLADLAEVAVAARGRATPELLDAPAGDRVCELAIERLTRTGHADDVTLLVAHRTGEEPPAFAVDVPAEPGQLAPLRAGLDGWLDACGAAEDDRWAVIGAVIEAVSNGVEHAYGDAGGRVRIRGELGRDGRACFTVSDSGRWREPDPGPDERGRGLIMMRAYMDSVQIETSDAGTAVLLDRELHHPAVLSVGPVAPPAPRDTPFGIAVDATGPVPHAVVTGPVDLATADLLRIGLRNASRGGALSLSVDLSGVTHLGSVGVHLLYQLAEEMLTDGRTLRLHAAAGTPAHHVLTLTGLDRVVQVGAA